MRVHSVLIAFALAALAGVAPTATAAPKYTLTDLTACCTDTDGKAATGQFANAINDHGHIAGSAQFVGAGQRAALWADGKWKNLGVLPNGARSFAVDLNNSDVVVGSSENGLEGQSGNALHAIAWSATGGLRDLGTLAGSPTGCNGYDCRSRASGINSSGVVTGESQVRHEAPNGQGCWCSNPFAVPFTRAMLYPADDLRNQNQSFSAYGINDAGTVVGQVSANGHQNETTILPGGATYGFEPSHYHPINNAGTVVGNTFGSGSAQYSGGALPSLPGDTRSIANAINDQGDIVGASTGNGCERAVIWKNGQYDAPIDLNTLVPDANYHMWEAYDINKKGQIVGGGTAGSSCPSSAVLKPFLLSATADDLEASSLEITQNIQKTTWYTPGSAAVPGYTDPVPGGVYNGVQLVEHVPTIVRFSPTVVPSTAAETHGSITATLRGYSVSGGTMTELPGSPVAPDARLGALATVPIGPFTPAMRSNPLGAFTFTLPDSWTAAGEIALVAETNPKDATGERPFAECDGCDTNNAFALTQIKLNVVSGFYLDQAQLTYSYPPEASVFYKNYSGPDLTPLLERVKQILPVRSDRVIVSPSPGPIVDMTNVVKNLARLYPQTKKADLSDCGAIPACRSYLLDSAIAVLKNAVGVPTGRRFTIGSFPMADGGAQAQIRTAAFGPHTPARPLTTQAHEILHLFGFKHAGTACPGSTPADGVNAGAPWPPDQRGLIQGVGLDRAPNSGRNGSPYEVMATEGVFEWFDLMSYCGDAGDVHHWISTINWDKFVTENLAPGGRGLRAADSTPQAPAAATAAASGPTLAIDVAVLPDGKNAIIQSGPGSGSVTRSEAKADYSVVVRNAAGKVVSKTGVTPLKVDDAPPGPGGLVTVNVPARGAASFELAKGKKVLVRARRPAKKPKLKLLSPRKGKVAAAKKLKLRWKVTGAGKLPLLATISYAADGRRYKPLITGVTRSSYVIPARTLTKGSKARLRVVVNDGFNKLTVTSGKLKVS